jgi:putative nucleotidyltransferase with HDIG domain
MTGGRPPRLLVKTLTITFAMVAALLVIVFFVVYMSVRDQVRQVVATNLESSQRLVSAIETRRDRDLRAQAENLAENPTLKAALDTYAAEATSSDESAHRQLLTMIDVELSKVAARFDSDAIVLADTHGTTLAAAGRLADRWPAGQHASFSQSSSDPATVDGVVRVSDNTFRMVAVPLDLGDGSIIGTLYLATRLDERYAGQLKELSRAEIAIVADGVLLTSTLPLEIATQFESGIAQSKLADGIVTLAGESTAYRRLVEIGKTNVYELASIDAASKSAMGSAVRSLALIAIGAALLAAIGSVTLAHRLTEPIGRLSASLQSMAAARDPDARLPITGSSRELDALTETFNALIASRAAAEAETEQAYTGAIRALAAALDARDPYTAGHSDRVSVLSVAIGRVLGLPNEQLEVLRLGALLHDVGKIGVPDAILQKPAPLTPSEYDVIKQHPVLGARILRSVPFLAPHIPIVELHHERPDGRGYPIGLRGDDIPLAARVVHVADAYDAMTSARAYRHALPTTDALRELWRCAGTQFHAEIVGALATALPGVTTPSETHPQTGELVNA